MPADLRVALSHGGTFFVAAGFQHSVFAVLVLDAPTNLGSTLINESAKLFERITDPALTVRRITLNANKVTPDEGIYQVDFFTDTKKLEKEKKLQQAMLGIKNKYGKNAVLKASSYEEGATMRQRNAQIGGHSAGGSDGKLQK